MSSILRSNFDSNFPISPIGFVQRAQARLKRNRCETRTEPKMSLRYEEVKDRLQEISGTRKAQVGAIVAAPRAGHKWGIFRLSKADIDNGVNTDTNEIWILGTGSETEFQQECFIEDLLARMGSRNVQLKWSKTPDCEGNWKVKF